MISEIKNVNKICVVYQTKHANIANQVSSYFIDLQIPVTLYELTKNLILSSVEEEKMIADLNHSDFIIPILHPIVKHDEQYELTRHIFEIIGNLDKENKAAVFPIYLNNNEIVDHKIESEEVRTPKLFFKSEKSYFWIDDIRNNENRNSLIKQINRFLELKELQEKEVLAKKEEFIKSTEDFTGKAVDDLLRRERNLKYISFGWSIIGFACLIMGIIIASLFIGQSFEINKDVPWNLLLLQITKNLILIVLLIAAARYSFMFSKTFMNESLKNSDRIHAIRFGDVYLRLFKKEIKFEEFKQVFELWNTKGDGYFLTIKSEDFDPDLLTKITELLKIKKS